MSDFDRLECGCWVGYKRLVPCDSDDCRFFEAENVEEVNKKEQEVQHEKS